MTDPLQLAQRCAAEMYAEDRASQRAGIRICDVAPGRATARMTVTDAMINGHAVCHGGYVFLLADTAFAFACNTYGVVTMAQACDIVFVRPARLGDELVATAVERGRYGRSGIYDVKVTCADDVVAEFRGRSRELRSGRSREPGTPT
jgi:acyl-CoA thioesterase